MLIISFQTPLAGQEFSLVAMSREKRGQKIGRQVIAPGYAKPINRVWPVIWTLYLLMIGMGDDREKPEGIPCILSASKESDF